MRYLFLIILIVGGVLGVNSYRTNKSNAPIPSKPDTVTIDNEYYYPDYLPYISKTVKKMDIKLPNTDLDLFAYTKLSGTGFHNEYLPVTSRLYMVQYKKSPEVEKYMDSRPVRVFEDNVFVIKASDRELKEMMKDENVNFIDHYHPHYKLDQKLVKAYYNQQITPETKLKIIFSSFSTQDEVKNILESVGVNVKVDFNKGVNLISGFSDRQQLFTLALNPEISEIDLVN